MDAQDKFYAKILLFGEHALMYGSQALSIPYFERFGYFSFSLIHQNSFDPANHLLRFAQYLRKRPQLPTHLNLNINALEKDIENGLVYNSNIPLSYGLGSSGSLVAAVYTRYGMNNIPRESTAANELKTLKQLFSEMESYFHGKSSGLDPLICYLQKAIVIKDDGTLSLIPERTFHPGGQGMTFLLDSGQKGETQSLVSYFADRCKSSDFLSRVQSELIPINNQCINAWVEGNKRALFLSLKLLSALTLDFMAPMVPDGFEQVWEQGLKTDDYYLKLCGSGGGGMILGFTRNMDKTKEILKDYPLYIVQKF